MSTAVMLTKEQVACVEPQKWTCEGKAGRVYFLIEVSIKEESTSMTHK